jgi:hypothetical protein
LEKRRPKPVKGEYSTFLPRSVECVEEVAFFMDKITREELKELSAHSRELCVSLFMPAFRAGRETEQNPIRFKNLLKEAENRLSASGARPPEIQELFKPARSLVDDPLFWQHQGDGLAVFLSADYFKKYRLPLTFQESVTLARRFHFTPLLPYFSGEGRFYVLALSRNMIRLLEGSRHSVDEVDVESLLPSLGDAFRFDRFEKQLQFHTGTAAGRSGGRAAMFHGHDPSDEEKGRLLRWFGKIDGDLPEILRGSRSPLVLAGVEYLLHLYREANSYPFLLEEGIPGNPDELRPEELHARAFPIAEKALSRAAGQALEKYAGLSGSESVSSNVEKILEGAHHGRVDVLFVDSGARMTGCFDPEENRVLTGESCRGEEEDLLNLAAVQTLVHGGTVYGVSSGSLPGGEPLGAVFRF